MKRTKKLFCVFRRKNYNIFMNILKKISANKLPFFFVATISVLIIGVVFRQFSTQSSGLDLTKPSAGKFEAPGRDWPSPKKVEAYFVERLHMTPQEAQESRSLSKGNDETVMLRLTGENTLEALLDNLAYYGFVRDKEALRYALEHTTDTVPGHANPLKIGENTIDLYASYQISEKMTAWEIADQLLNHPTYFSFDEYHYMFMP